MTKSEQRYRNALLWIRAVADVRYLSQDFTIEHMRELATLADGALAGRDLPDFDASMTATRQKARDIADRMVTSLTSAKEEVTHIVTELDEALEEAGAIGDNLVPSARDVVRSH
jgi:hypothetical protein